jgi:hypothetical protein
MTTKNTDQLKKVTGMTEIPFVSEGIASATSGYVVSEDGITALVEASFNAETSAARVAELEQQLAAANTAKQTAESNLANANAALQTANNLVVELEKEVKELGKEDAAASETSKGKDEFAKEGIDAMEMDFQKDLLKKI